MYDKKDMDYAVIELLRNYIMVRNTKSAFALRFCEIFIVWKAKVLQNWKYLLATNIPDDLYYEVTYNGDKKEFYIDEYVKINNSVIDWSE